MPDRPSSTRTLPLWVVLVLAIVPGLTVLCYLCHDVFSFAADLANVFLEGLCVACVAVSAGGFGGLVLRFIKPSGTPPVLGAITAIGIGLWIISSAVLAVGSFTTGLLTGWLWWPIIGAGAALAVVQWRRETCGASIDKPNPQSETLLCEARYAGRSRVRNSKSPAGASCPSQRFRCDLWTAGAAIAFGLAAAIWLAGASRPPGLIGWYLQGDSYDVLLYHLQVPREFYNAQHIAPLTHNVYSFYPLGVEMLYLLGMALRGGAYEGMYMATLMHGMFGVLAVVAVFASLRSLDRVRAVASAILLATVPSLLYLGWMAMDELAQILYLTLTLLWLRQWLATRSLKSAACIGLMLGASCSTKYLAVGFLAGPVLAVMFMVSIKSIGRMKGLALAAVLTVTLLGPWMIRDTVLTGNPVFPLANTIFGRGYWPAESQQRWNDGHGWQNKPPVPQPPMWRPPDYPTKLQTMTDNFLPLQMFALAPVTPVMLLLAGGAVVLLLVRCGRRLQWELALVSVIVLQLAVWTITHDTPWRFVSPCAVPIALLGGTLIGVLAAIAWARVAAAVVLAAVTAMNLLTAVSIYHADTKDILTLPWAGQDVAASTWPWSLAASLPEGSRIMLVGDCKAFYFPASTVYATPFDPHPLDEMVRAGMSPQQIMGRLRAMGVTHIWVDWPEIFRLSKTYGYPASLGGSVFGAWVQNQPPHLPVLDELMPLGLRQVPLDGGNSFVPRPYNESTNQPAIWPVISIYALPTEQK